MKLRTSTKFAGSSSSFNRISLRLSLAIVTGGITTNLTALAMAMTTTTTTKKVIDGHLHVWADANEASKTYPYAIGQEPPESLQNVASTKALLKKMDAARVDGSLIVQPINHKFDHSYVTSAIKAHPRRFKGMLLHDPSLSAEKAVSQLEDLALQGFVGVRFNPYLWPKTTREGKDGQDKNGWVHMSALSSGGLAVYKRCAELHMPVGIMCFQGLQLHYDDILELLKASPETRMVIDHFGFTSFTEEGEAAFVQLLQLSKYPQIVVKISALFRLNDKDGPPFDRVRKERFQPLLDAFGSDRLMFGTDFPFVLEQPEMSYGGTVDLVRSWLETEEDRANVMGGTAEQLFGPW